MHSNSTPVYHLWSHLPCYLLYFMTPPPLSLSFLFLSLSSNGLPPSNEDDESIHSGSTRSEGPPLPPPVQLVGKGKQLPKVLHALTV